MSLITRVRALSERPTGRVHDVLDAVDRMRGQPIPQRPLEREPRSTPARTARVSVIIPCFNYGRFLPDSVGSALAQQGVDVEVIVVDDASTDDSAGVADRLADADDRVTVLRNEVNAGHVQTFNNGYAKAGGEFIVRLDADDLLTPGALARAVALFDACPQVGLVYGYPRHFTGDSPPAPHAGRISWSTWSGRDWVAHRCRTGVNCITTPEAMVRASVMQEVGPLRTELKFAQDMEMWLRVAAASDVGRVNGADQALHRDHAASMSETVGAGALLDLAERRLVFDLLFERMGARIDADGRLHALARRALAAEALSRAYHAYDRGRVAVEPVDEFVDFAVRTCPDYATLPQWRALGWRRAVGPRASRWVPLFLAGAVGRRVRYELAYLRWTRQGI